MMETEIRACPFCGGEAHAALAAYAGGATAHVVCDACGAKVYGYGRGERGLRDAVERWNRRAERTCEQRRTRRTCRDVGGLDQFVCSECGASLYMLGMYDDPTYWVDDVAAALEYCPNCGAKVVDE